MFNVKGERQTKNYKYHPTTVISFSHLTRTSLSETLGRSDLTAYITEALKPKDECGHGRQKQRNAGTSSCTEPPSC